MLIPLFRAVLWITGLALIILVRTDVAAAQPVNRNWCTHSGAQRINTDLNGDMNVDAICHDTRSGAKWVVINQNGVLTQVWANETSGWCIHSAAQLHAGDVNGDRRADLICKDPRRIWVDLQSSGFFEGTDYHLDTNWCTHQGSGFLVRDENSDGRADLVCTTTGTSNIFVDLADSSGWFGGTDFHGICASQSLQAPFQTSDSTSDGSADRNGDMKVRLSVSAAGDSNEEVFVQRSAFNRFGPMRAAVSVSTNLVSGGLSIAGLPGPVLPFTYGQAGASVRLEIIRRVNSPGGVRDEILCSDNVLLNEAEAPGFNLDVPLVQPRSLFCSAEVQGNFQTRITLRGWATAVATQTNMDAHLRVVGVSVRTCTPSS